MRCCMQVSLVGIPVQKAIAQIAKYIRERYQKSDCHKAHGHCRQGTENRIGALAAQ